MLLIVLLLVLVTFITTCVVFILNSVIISLFGFLVYWIILNIIGVISFCKRKKKLWWTAVFNYLSNNTYCFLWKVVAPLLLILYILSLCIYTDKEKDICKINTPQTFAFFKDLFEVIDEICNYENDSYII